MGRGGDSAGLAAAGAGAHRTGPVGAAARGCALAPGGEAAGGGTGGIRSPNGDSCTDSGGWAGAGRGGGRRERAGRASGRGRGAGRGARARLGTASGARARLPHLPSFSCSSLSRALRPARSPAARQPPTQRGLGGSGEWQARARSTRAPVLSRPWAALPATGSGLGGVGKVAAATSGAIGQWGLLSLHPARANYTFNLRLIRLSPWKKTG